MRYIICENDEKASMLLKQKISDIEPDADILVYSSAEAMLFNIEDIRSKIDAVFMDIKLKNENGLNGISAIERLLDTHPETKPVYVTGYAKEYLQDMYTLPSGKHPIAVLVKPVETKYLRNALEKIKDLSKKTSYFPIKTGGTIKYINTDDIISINSDRRKFIIHCLNDTYSTYGKLSDCLSELPDKFVQCHKSYIINLDHISQIKGWNSIIMTDGSEYPISRTYREQVKITAALIEL